MRTKTTKTSASRTTATEPEPMEWDATGEARELLQKAREIGQEPIPQSEQYEDTGKYREALEHWGDRQATIQGLERSSIAYSLLGIAEGVSTTTALSVMGMEEEDIQDILRKAEQHNQIAAGSPIKALPAAPQPSAKRNHAKERTTIVPQSEKGSN